jgi:hypothetical protein
LDQAGAVNEWAFYEPKNNPIGFSYHFVCGLILGLEDPPAPGETPAHRPGFVPGFDGGKSRE